MRAKQGHYERRKLNPDIPSWAELKRLHLASVQEARRYRKNHMNMEYTQTVHVHACLMSAPGTYVEVSK